MPFTIQVLKFQYQPACSRVTTVSSLLSVSFLTTGVKTIAILPQATKNSSNHFYYPPTLIKTEMHALPVVPSLSVMTVDMKFTSHVLQAVRCTAMGSGNPLTGIFPPHTPNDL